MKILMVNVPFSGHVNPTLALASELTKRGHSVSYILTKDWKERIEESGAEFIPYIGHEEYEITFRKGKPANLWKALKAWRYVYDSIVAVGSDYDLLIYEFFTYTAYAAAQKIGIKVVRQFSTFALNSGITAEVLQSSNLEIKLMKNDFFMKVISKIACGKIKLTTGNIISEIANTPVDLNIVYTTSEFQINSEAFDESYLFVGPAIAPRKINLVIPYGQMQGKIIYISLGTLQNEKKELYRKFMEAFAHVEGISVIMSVGYHTDINELGEIPHNFFIYSFVPQLDVLKHSQIFITHGGMNSVNEGLYYQNKLLVIPMDMDQFSVADRVEELGVGYQLKEKRLDSKLIFDKIKKLEKDSRLAMRVKSMSQHMRDAGGVVMAADKIEKLVE